MNSRVLVRKTEIENFGEGSLLELSCSDCGYYNLIDTVISLPSNCYNCGKKFSALKVEMLVKKLKYRVIHHKLKRGK